jgi:cell division protein FtsB
MYNETMKRKFNIFRFTIAFVAFYFAVETIFNLFYFLNTNANYKQKLKELETLKQENQQLKDKIKYANSDEFIEKYARENLGLGKENETVVYFEKKEENIPEQEQKVENLFQKLLKLFKK